MDRSSLWIALFTSALATAAVTLDCDDEPVISQKGGDASSPPPAVADAEAIAPTLAS